MHFHAALEDPKEAFNGVRVNVAANVLARGQNSVINYARSCHAAPGVRFHRELTRPTPLTTRVSLASCLRPDVLRRVGAERRSANGTINVDAEHVGYWG
jgi:hypothetical protein